MASGTGPDDRGEAPKPFLMRVEMRWEKVPSREGYPWALPFLRNFTDFSFTGPVTLFVGENGSGKSTFLEGIAETCGLNSEGGSRNHNFITTKHRSPIAPFLRPVRSHRYPETDFFLRAESFYNVISEYEKMRGMGESLAYLHTVSHGEGFRDILMKRFGPSGLYFMDEPESALSPQNQLVLLRRMAQLVATGSQFIVATHSPIILAYPGAQITQFTPEGLAPISYRETDHYMITRRVLEDPERYVRRLLEDFLPPSPDQE